MTNLDKLNQIVNKMVRESEVLHYQLVTRAWKGDTKAANLTKRARLRYQRRKDARRMLKAMATLEARRISQGQNVG